MVDHASDTSIDHLTRTLGSLAAAITDPSTRDPSTVSQPVTRRQGIVRAITGNTLTVELGGVNIPGMAHMTSYTPTVNDVVWIYFAGTDAHVMGKLA